MVYYFPNLRSKMGRVRSTPLSDFFYKTDFKELAKQEDDAKVRMKLFALNLVQKGKKVAEVASLLEAERCTINDWINRFNNCGIEKLRTQGERGRKNPIDGIEGQFKDAVKKLQKERMGGRIICKDIQRMLEEDFGISRSTDVIYGYLKKVNLVWISSRSRNPKSNKKEQENFKENFLEIVKKNS